MKVHICYSCHLNITISGNIRIHGCYMMAAIAFKTLLQLQDNMMGYYNVKALNLHVLQGFIYEVKYLMVSVVEMQMRRTHPLYLTRCQTNFTYTQREIIAFMMKRLKEEMGTKFLSE